MSDRKIAEFVQVLREATEPQARDNLVVKRNSDDTLCFCALGLYGYKQGVFEVYVHPFSNGVTTYNPNNRHEYVSHYEVASEIGLTADERAAVIMWNDCQGLSFREIADKIEAEFPA